MYEIILYKEAVKFYNKTTDNLRQRIDDAIDAISRNPNFNIHIKKLRGELSHMHRYRAGDIRILYEIHQDIKTVRIKIIEVRGSAYR